MNIAKIKSDIKKKIKNLETKFNELDEEYGLTKYD